MARKSLEATSAEAYQKIFKAAETLFAEQGYAETGIQQIARRAGVNSAMLHYYFGSKEKLMKAIIEKGFDDFSQVFKQIETNKTTMPLEQVFDAFFPMMDRHQKVFKIAMMNMIHTHLPETRLSALKFSRKSTQVLLDYFKGLGMKNAESKAQAAKIMLAGIFYLRLTEGDPKIINVAKNVFMEMFKQ